ncbi:MAG: hypothetical protein IPH93_07335 [Saprospiraceae bacterium]|nr:hypothetical protein [Saprospiraceae bacterium]MBK7811117.1 hypothetical protein [Saprospiraceae bacterium]MBK9630715.1 hypothetical protein [Saprospiraceae bacterium]
MRDFVFIAVAAVGSWLALQGGMDRLSVSLANAQTECCDDMECCPMGCITSCCESGGE